MSEELDLNIPSSVYDFLTGLVIEPEEFTISTLIEPFGLQLSQPFVDKFLDLVDSRWAMMQTSGQVNRTAYISFDEPESLDYTGASNHIVPNSLFFRTPGITDLLLQWRCIPDISTTRSQRNNWSFIMQDIPCLSSADDRVSGFVNWCSGFFDIPYGITTRVDRYSWMNPVGLPMGQAFRMYSEVFNRFRHSYTRSYAGAPTHYRLKQRSVTIRPYDDTKWMQLVQDLKNAPWTIVDRTYYSYDPDYDEDDPNPPIYMYFLGTYYDSNDYGSDTYMTAYQTWIDDEDPTQGWGVADPQPAYLEGLGAPSGQVGFSFMVTPNMRSYVSAHVDFPIKMTTNSPKAYTTFHNVAGRFVIDNFLRDMDPDEFFVINYSYDDPFPEAAYIDASDFEWLVDFRPCIASGYYQPYDFDISGNVHYLE